MNSHTVYYEGADDETTPTFTISYYKPSVSFKDKSPIQIEWGKTLDVSNLYSINHKGAFDFTPTYKSSNENIFTVDKNGVITPKNLGDAQLTVTITDGVVNKTATKNINVKAPNLGSNQYLVNLKYCDGTDNGETVIATYGQPLPNGLTAPTREGYEFQLMRDLGSIPSPFNAYILNLGLESLALRMKQHCANAQRVAEWLEKNPRVSWVNYCGLPSNKYYPLAQKYLPNGSCGVIAFGLKGTREDAIKFMDNLDFISIVTHVADTRTCVLHPASHTHRQLSEEQLREAGVAPDLVRLSVGIENVDDIIADLEQAMAKMG